MGTALPSIGANSGLVVGWIAALVCSRVSSDSTPYATLAFLAAGGLIGYLAGVLLRWFLRSRDDAKLS